VVIDFVVFSKVPMRLHKQYAKFVMVSIRYLVLRFVISPRKNGGGEGLGISPDFCIN